MGAQSMSEDQILIHMTDSDRHDSSAQPLPTSTREEIQISPIRPTALGELHRRWSHVAIHENDEGFDAGHWLGALQPLAPTFGL